MASKPSIIGVSGWMRTGKDSVAKLLIDSFGYKKASFAGPLRKMALDIDPHILLEGAPEDILDFYFPRVAVLYSELLEDFGYEKAKEIPDFRRFLQRLGTEGVRNNFGDDAWVNLAKKTIQNELSPSLGGPRWVIPDVRFPNEAKAVRDLGGVVWRTMRPGFGGGEHPSEALVMQITPDVILEADSLLGWEEEVEDDIMPGVPYLKYHQGLGELVVEQLGLDPVKYQDELEVWANSVGHATVTA